MRQSDVIEWLHDEIQTFLATSSLVSMTQSEADDHVDLANGRTDHPLPFVGIQKVAGTNDSAGVGSGQLFVDDISYDGNGIAQSIDYRRDATLRVNVIPLTDDDAKLRDDLASDLADHLTLSVRDDTLHDDIDAVDVGEATPQGRTDEFVYGDGIPVEFEYSRYLTDDSITPAATVNVDVDVEDEDGNAADAIDESF